MRNCHFPCCHVPWIFRAPEVSGDSVQARSDGQDDADLKEWLAQAKQVALSLAWHKLLHYFLLSDVRYHLYIPEGLQPSWAQQ